MSLNLEERGILHAYNILHDKTRFTQNPDHAITAKDIKAAKRRLKTARYQLATPALVEHLTPLVWRNPTDTGYALLGKILRAEKPAKPTPFADRAFLAMEYVWLNQKDFRFANVRRILKEPKTAPNTPQKVPVSERVAREQALAQGRLTPMFLTLETGLSKARGEHASSASTQKEFLIHKDPQGNVVTREFVVRPIVTNNFTSRIEWERDKNVSGNWEDLYNAVAARTERAAFRLVEPSIPPSLLPKRSAFYAKLRKRIILGTAFTVTSFSIAAAVVCAVEASNAEHDKRMQKFNAPERPSTQTDTASAPALRR